MSQDRSPLDRAEDWNRKHPIGTAVTVRKDDGTRPVTKTRSEAWALGGHTPVILVEGIAGCYLLNRLDVLALEGIEVAAPTNAELDAAVAAAAAADPPRLARLLADGDPRSSS